MKPLVGNWNGGIGVGADRASTIGAYDPTTGAFFLRNSNTPGAADIVFTFGAGGAAVIRSRVTGTATASTRSASTTRRRGRSSSATRTRRVRRTSCSSFGVGGIGLIPVVGDWNGDGVDTIGVYDATTGGVLPP